MKKLEELAKDYQEISDPIGRRLTLNNSDYYSFIEGFKKAKELILNEVIKHDLGDADYISDFIIKLGEEDETKQNG